MSDLISREALKKKLQARHDNGEEDFDKGYNIGIETAIDLINNAPTVFSCNACKNMGNEWECRDCHDYSNYIHYEERSQGRWFVFGEYKDKTVLKCQCCKSTIVVPDDYRPKFCEYCGADMRKGGAERTTNDV